jgi:single-strand DNA-binding protein
MSATKDPLPQPDKTPAQLWSRRERINQKIAALQQERTEITKQLEAELQKN